MSQRFNLSDWTLHHRTLVGFLLLAIAVMGIVAYGRLSQAEDPPFTFKLMVIRSFWPGASALQVERQLTDKIEKKLQEMPFIDRVQSFSRPGESTVMFFAKDSTPPAMVPEVFYQVRKKIGDIRQNLPAGIQGPFFNDEFGDVFGSIYALTAEGLDYPQLKDIAERLRDDLLRIPGVGKVEIFGVQDEKIFVELSNAKLATLGVDQATIVQALSQQNAVAGAGFFELQDERIQIRPGGAYDTVQAVADTLIRSGSRSFRLGDIATVRRGTSDPPAPEVRYGGKRALAIGVAMAPGGDIIQLGKALNAHMVAARAKLPLGVEIGEAASQPDAVKRSIDAFVRALAEAVFVVLLVTFLSLGLRTGLVVALSIPLVLAATFLAMNLFNVGLHKVSLGALVLALGLLVDDAIIAVEMMWVKMEQGWERTRAASFAYTSTAGPMLSGTLVTVAGFIPIAIAKSSTGEYAFAFFQINAIALLISWLAAVVAIPWLGYKLLPDPRAPRKPGLIARRWPALAQASGKAGHRRTGARRGSRCLRDAFLQPLPPTGPGLRQAALAGDRHHAAAVRAGDRRHGQGAEAVLPEFDAPRTQCRTAPAGRRLADRNRRRNQKARSVAGPRPGGIRPARTLHRLPRFRLAALLPGPRPAVAGQQRQPVRHRDARCEGARGLARLTDQIVRK